MSHRKLPVLALAASGALLLTTISVPTALAADSGVAHGASLVQKAEVTGPAIDVPVTSLSLWPDRTVLVPGQQITVGAEYDTRTAQSGEVTWSSSDESVLSVEGHGRVTAKGVGSAVITATDNNDSSMIATASIQVRPVTEETGIELSESSLTLTAGHSAILNPLLAPSLRGAAVSWSIEPSSLGQVSPNSDGVMVFFTASEQPGSGTLSATVTTMVGTAKSATIPVRVDPNVTGDFVIDDKGVLTDYKGKDTDVVIPDNVTTIGRHAFSGSHAENIWVPASVTDIDEEGFGANSYLKTITFQDDDAHPSRLTSVGNRAFTRTSLKEVTLPRSVVQIYDEAFAEIHELTSVHLGPNVAAGQLTYGFIHSPNLVSIDVDSTNPNYASVDGVLYTKDHSDLVAFPLGKNVGGSYAVVEGTVTIDEGAFEEAKLESVTFPSTLRHVGSRAFAHSSVTALTLPDAFETMGSMAFWYMPRLARLNLGGALKVPHSAFRYNNALSEVDLRPDLNRLSEIGEGAFEEIAASSITLPDSVRSIGESSFARNRALTKLHLGASLASIGSYALGGDDNLATITVSPNSSVYSVDSGVLYAKLRGGRQLALSLPTNTVSELIVPADTVEISSWALRNNTALKRVVLPEGLTSIGYGAFDGCSNLTELVIPDSVEVSRGVVNTGLDTVEYGTKIRDVWMTSRGVRMARHIIVRGGVDGSFYTDGDATNGRPESAFFGEGMTTIEFMTEAPRVLVLPSTVTRLAIEPFPRGGQQPDIEVYVAASEGSPAWSVAKAAMAEAKIDASHLHVYTPAQLALSGEGVSEAGDGYTLRGSVGASATVSASVEGGVASGREMRVVRVEADGSDTVVQDWSAMTSQPDGSSSLSYTRLLSTQYERLRVDVRDATRIVRSVRLSVENALAPPNEDPSPTPREGTWTWSVRGWWYRYADGSYPASEKLTIGGQVYRFDEGGYMRTGWVSDEGVWYYHGGSGAQVSGWVLDGLSWYYLAPGSGAMATGWLDLGGSWYYLAPGSGAMATGWLKDGDSWYYLTPGSGAMATGRVLIGSSWYRFDASGRWVG